MAKTKQKNKLTLLKGEGAPDLKGNKKIKTECTQEHLQKHLNLIISLGQTLTCLNINFLVIDTLFYLLLN